MTDLRVILGDQLSHSISRLEGCDKKNDVFLMCEVWEEATYVKHHKKKIAIIFSKMRHFTEELKDQSYHYTKLEDPKNTGSFRGEIERAIKQHAINKIVVTYPGEYRVLQDLRQWEQAFRLPVEIREDNRFLCSPDDFKEWSESHKQLRMEYSYREMRKKYSILMNGDVPIGGKWNYDTENRKSPKESLTIPPTYQVKPNALTQEVMTLVNERFDDHFGDLEPFHFAVTRDQALVALNQFIDQRLAH
jgi:(6-4)DNA photolyase